MMFWLERNCANGTRAARHATLSENRRRIKTSMLYHIPLPSRRRQRRRVRRREEGQGRRRRRVRRRCDRSPCPTRLPSSSREAVMRQHDQVFEIYQQAPSQIAEEDRAVFCTSHRHCMAEETPLQIFQKSEGVQKFLQASRHAYPVLSGCAEQCPAAQDGSLAEGPRRIASC